jgi:asparagine synthase (glutamine-hydrolysing)
MCGIAGVVRFDRPATASRDEVRSLRARLAHRGPDGQGEAFASFAAVAHTRLAMLDAEGGAQPARSPDGRYLLVYNGELYNDAELRAELGGPWRTRCDTETVLAAWARWGPGCLDRLDGMYAFFIWDEMEQAGHAVRDRLGVKPFAYRTDVGFAFASEARALLALQPGPPRADLEAVVEYLVAPAFSGVARSPFQGIRYLEPGHLLRVDRAGVHLQRAWSWEPAHAPGEPAPGPDELRDALARAVRAAARSDARIGVFLSGGLDSTAVAALAGAPAGTLPAFTITFDGQARWEGGSALVISDDTPFAREVGEALGLDRHEVPFDRRTLAAELKALALANDALPAWEQELSQRALARAAAREVKGILVGDAADETHYGYHFLLDRTATSGPAAILRRLGIVPVRREVDPDPVSRLDAEYRALVEEAGGRFGSEEDRVVATTHLIVRRWLPRLLHNGDIHCMAFGLEPRVPFASLPLLELAARVGPSVGLRGGVEKWLLREALRGVVPERVRVRRKSALPKDQEAGPIYQEALRMLMPELHPVVRAAVDLQALAPLLHPSRGPPSEPESAQLFRVLCLHHWAVAHEVAAP